MQKDFHFYVIYYLSQKAGFSDEDSDKIAFCSQYVDDNNELQYADPGDSSPELPVCIKTEDSYYHPIMTQSASYRRFLIFDAIQSMDPNFQRCVFVPFHFLPGDGSVEFRTDKSDRNSPMRSNPYSTTPDCPLSMEVVDRAISIRDDLRLYRLGIALHTYADTWSHQNFTGFNERWNEIKWWDRIPNPAPNIGHCDVGTNADEISETWTDYRFEKGSPRRKVINKDRAFEAIEKVYEKLCAASDSQVKSWDEIKDDIEKKIVNANDYDDRIDNIRELCQKPKLIYDRPARQEWYDKIVKRENGEFRFVDGWDDSESHCLQKAAKEQLAFVMQRLP